MPNATQGTIKDGNFTTLSMVGNVPSTSYTNGTIIIKGSGGIALENGSAYIGGSVHASDIVETGDLKILNGAIPGLILRAASDPIGLAFWDQDGDARIFGDYGGDIHFQFGSFGIGITTPIDMLHVKENIRTDQNLIFTNPYSNVQFPEMLTFNTNQYFFGSTYTTGLGIGATATEALDVVGNIKLSGNLVKNSETFVIPTIGTTSDILVATTYTQTLYNKTLDYPNVQGHIDLQNSGRVTNVNNPVNLQDVATKDYVDTFARGLDAQESVKDKDLQIPPGSPADRDRYLIAIGATGDWAGKDDNIVQYDTFLAQWIFSPPDHGMATIVEDENKMYIYNGSQWVLFDTLTRHGETQGLDQDDHIQYQLLAGRTGGQIIHGGIEANDDLTIFSTSNATRGNIILASDGGNVAIGTTNPSGQLQVESQNADDLVVVFNNKDDTANTKLQLTVNSSSSKTWEITNQASSGDFVITDLAVGERFVIENGSSGPIRFNSGGEEWARFDGGYLGIGTTNPSERLTIGNLDNELDETLLVQANNNAKLTLNSNISNTNDSDTSYVEFITKNSGQTSLVGLVGSAEQHATDTRINALLVEAGGETDVQIATDDQVRLTIGSTGYVGINNTTPNARFTINDNLDAHNGLTLGATENIGIKVGQSSLNHLDILWNYDSVGNNGYAEIGCNIAANNLILQTAGGSVGLGVTQPQDTLDVLGNIRLSGTINRSSGVFTLPTSTDTLIGRVSTDTLENKQLKDETVVFVNNDDTTKKVQFDIADATTSTGTTFRFIQSADQILTFPDNTDTIVGVSTAAHLSNKDLSGNVLENIVSGSGTVTFSPVTISGDTVAYLNATQSLTNKTLVAPSVVGTLTQAEGGGIVTDRIQAINSNGIVFQDSSGNMAFSLTDGGFLGVGITNALADLHVSGDMTRIDSNLRVNTDTLYVAVTSTNVGINTNDPLHDLHVVGDGLFTGDVIIDGNFTVNGTQTIIDSTIASVKDSMVKYADGNVADTLDIGFYGTYIDTGVTKSTGFFRDATDKRFRLFKDLEIDIGTTNIIDVGASGYTKAEIVVGTINTDNLDHDSDLYLNGNQGIFTSTGNFGLLTTNPNETLHVNGTVQLGTQLYVRNSNVGIHHSDPVNKLDVIGSARIQGSASSLLSGTVDPDGTTTLTGSSTSFLSEIIAGDRITVGAETRTVQSVTNDTTLVVDTAFSNVAPTTATRIPALLVLNDNSSAHQIIVRDDGCLGIDVNTVSYPLQVEKQAASTWSAKFQNGESTLFLGHSTGLGMNIQTGNVSDTSYAIKVSNDTLPLLRLQNDNKLGIGTDSPGELVHVHGTAVGDGARICNAKIGVWEGNTAYTALTHNDVHATSTSYLVKQHNTGETTINSASAKDIHFAINDVDQMWLKPSGRLGIGTSDPTDVLHVWGGSMVTGNLHVSGNLVIDGVIESLSTNEIRVQDSMLKFADGNTSDLIDIGLYAQYNDGVNKYTGLIRNDADKKWYLFDGLTVEPGTTQANMAHSSFGYGDLVSGNLEIYATSGTTGTILFKDEDGATVNEIISTPETVTFGTSGVFQFSSSDAIVASIDDVGNFTVSGDLTTEGFVSNGNGTFNGNVIATGNLEVQGLTNFPNLETNNVKFNLINITDDITVGTTYHYYIADASGGNVIITLPASHDASDPSLIGYTFHFVKTDSSSNRVIVNTSGSDLMDGSYTQYVLDTQYERLKLSNIGGSGSVGLWFSD